jgi:hypothetical protein
MIRRARVGSRVPFQQSIDHVHDRKLDGLAIFEQGHGVQLHIDALLHAFDHAGVEIAEELAAKGGGAALLSGDFDVGAVADVGTFGKWNGHETTPEKNARIRVNL